MAVFFDNDGNGRPDHVGIVSSVSGDSFSAVEGNSSGVCAENVYPLSSELILFYGIF